MLAFNPDERLKIDEVLNHSWMQGETPNEEDVLAEF